MLNIGTAGSLFTGHIAQATHLVSDDEHRLFHVVGLASLMGYSFALWQISIWYRRP